MFPYKVIQCAILICNSFYITNCESHYNRNVPGFKNATLTEHFITRAKGGDDAKNILELSVGANDQFVIEIEKILSILIDLPEDNEINIGNDCHTPTLLRKSFC